ncbi:MAG TPA: hypothetical protein VMF60_02615, partial [Acidimicrobiales bacterium]|nr:hypothetical protein [Acidimicrobiales bacterium]
NPEVCPGSNAKARARMLEGLNPEHAEKVARSLGLETVFGPIHLDPSHRTLAVFEAGSVEAVNKWVIETGLFQWNTVEVSATTPIEEMMTTIMSAPIVFD